MLMRSSCWFQLFMFPFKCCWCSRSWLVNSIFHPLPLLRFRSAPLLLPSFPLPEFLTGSVLFLLSASATNFLHISSLPLLPSFLNWFVRELHILIDLYLRSVFELPSSFVCLSQIAVRSGRFARSTPCSRSEFQDLAQCILARFVILASSLIHFIGKPLQNFCLIALA